MSESYRELSTILAALRFYQRSLAAAGPISTEIDQIADSGGEIEPLHADEIGDLCEALNCSGYLSPHATPAEHMAHALRSGLTVATVLSALTAQQVEKEPGLAPYWQNAREMSYVRDGEVETDAQGPGGASLVSLSDDPGAYVLGWIWVPDDVAGISRDGEETDPENEQGLD